MPETYYEILGVPRDAPDREIKQAYLTLARRLHPDVCREAGSEERFKRINEAYRVLSNQKERGRYDALGHEKYRRSVAGSPDLHRSPGSPYFRGFSDIFDLFFSERAWGPAGSFRPKSVSDILVRIQITFEEAVLGCERVIEVPYAIRCEPCGGTGSTEQKVHPCPRCRGSGREGGGARWDLEGPGSPLCRECSGRGRIPEAPCPVCGGWGATQVTRRVTIHIPPGIDTGMRIRKEGLGEGGDDIPKGDLYVEVTVLPHERFTRKGDDLEIPVHISPAKAVLGSVAELEAVDGKMLRVEIPPHTRHDAAVRVRGKGVRLRDRSGDLLVRVKVDTPEKTTPEERELYRKILRLEERRRGRGGKGMITGYLSKIRDSGR